MITIGLPYIDYYSTVRRARKSEWQRKRENNKRKLHYIKPRIEEWESVHYTVVVGNIRLNRIGSVLDTQD